MHKKMKTDAINKRAGRARKIALCEKKYPVYGFGDVKSDATKLRLEKMGIVADETGINLGSVTFDMSLFDDANQAFDKEKLSTEQADALCDFLIKKSKANQPAFNKSPEFSELVTKSLTFF